MVSLESENKVWIFTRNVPNQPEAPIICHVLNWEYDTSTDKMNKQLGITIHLNNKLLDDRKLREATLFAPQGKPTQLSFKRSADGVNILVPELDLWGVLKLVC